MEITKEIAKIVSKVEDSLQSDFKAIDDICLHNQNKVLQAFIKNRIALRHFNPSTGYGYGDEGREVLGKVFADIFGGESGIVSPHILSGTHAITLGIYALLRHGDTLLSISGKPYDTLINALCGEGDGSLADYGIKYAEVPLLSGKFDRDAIRKQLTDLRPKMVFIQRSRGYTLRSPFSVSEIGEIVNFVKEILPQVIVFVDNCYGEFTEKSEPPDVGADIIAGSLIKNPGGGIAPNGGYIIGNEKLIECVANRLTVPFLGREIGSNHGGYQYYFQGIFMAPHVTSQALKGALFMGGVMTELGYTIHPQGGGICYDLIRAIEFDTEEELISFCRTVQEVSPVDSYVTPYPWDMPGYDVQVIMSAGCFVQGSSIELSCDAPIKSPYIAYCQGGLTYEHVKLAAIYCGQKLMKLKSAPKTVTARK